VSSGCFPRLRWVFAAWVAIYIAAYTVTYGVANFLFLCNLSVILAAAGVFVCSRVLLSSQAVSILLVGPVWAIDVVSRLVTGSHVIGGTEYMWDPRWPLVTRLMSLYHVILPVVLVTALRRIGYDSRGYLLQSAIAVVGVAAGRLFGPAANINGAFADPILKRTWGGASTQVLVVAGFLVLVAYPLSHLLLVRLCPPPKDAEPAP
jgi:hypothetical protein